MRRLLRFLSDRRVAIASTLAFAAAAAIGTIVPQAPSPPTGVWARPPVPGIVGALGLDRVFSSGWFAAIIGFFAIALAVAVTGQLRLAWRRTFTGPTGSPGHLAEGTTEDVVARARHEGYLRIGRDEAVRLVKHPWGYWGVAVLHCGMVAAVTAVALTGYTRQWVKLGLAEGETAALSGGWQAEQHGAMARPLSLAGSLRLDSVQPGFWPDGETRSLASDLTLLDAGGGSRPVRIAVNAPTYVDGVRFYQAGDYGHSFYVEVSGEGLVSRERFDITQPERTGDWSYADLTLAARALAVQTKYRVQPDGTPLLVIRLRQAGVPVQVSVQEGGSGTIAGVTFRLVAVRRWAGLVLERTLGIPFLFASFALILLGAALIYLTPAREVLVWQEEGRAMMRWRAGRFADGYAAEAERIAGGVAEKGRE